MESTLFSTDSSSKIFVGNVPFNCTDEEFKETFKYLDGYVTAELISRSQSNSTRGFGFVTFLNKNYVDEFLERKDKIILRDRILRFTKYYNYDDSEFMIKNLKKNNIYVTGIPNYFDNNKLKEFFSNYGKVLLGYINTDILTGKKVGTGYIEFVDDESYKKVINLKKIHLNDGNTINIYKFKENKTKTNNYDIREIYKIAFNAGKNYATIENKA